MRIGYSSITNNLSALIQVDGVVKYNTSINNVSLNSFYSKVKQLKVFKSIADAGDLATLTTQLW